MFSILPKKKGAKESYNDHLNQYIKTILMTEYKINNIEKEYTQSTSEEDKQTNFMNSKFCLYELSK